MIIEQIGKDTYIKYLKDFDLAQTLECGQCFRFNKLDEQKYVVIVNGYAVKISFDNNILIFYDTSSAQVESFWVNYFDLNRDYGLIKEYLLKSDKRLEKAINDKKGIRILNQPFEETLISFIISQNKQIPHIKKLVETISVNYGDYIATIEGKDYYSFPNAEVLANITEEQWREIKVGFRAPYLYDASQKLKTKEIAESMFCKTADTNKSAIKSNEGINQHIPQEEAIDILTSIKGVGEKVANCVMLFALGYREAFPVDVWIKRIMEHLYFDGKETDKKVITKFAKEQFGEYGGYAQQYLFSYGKDMKLGK